MPKSTVDRLAAEVGGLSRPSKPACLAYSLPRGECHMGCRYAKIPGSVCEDKVCYAGHRFYYMPAVKAAMWRRFRQLQHCEGNSFRIAQWCTAFAAALNTQFQNTQTVIKRTGRPPKVDGRYFRWFDSGDVQGIWHLKMVFGVCQRTPDVKHELPTKETEVLFQTLKQRTIPDNLVIKLSAPFIDMPAMPLQEQLAAEHARINIAQVYEKKPSLYRSCPVTVGRMKTCASCRICWGPTDISFRRHR